MVRVKVNTDVVNQTGEVLWLLGDQLGDDALDHIDAIFIDRCTDFVKPDKGPAEGNSPPRFPRLGEFEGEFDLEEALYEVEGYKFRTKAPYVEIINPGSATYATLPAFISPPLSSSCVRMTFQNRRWTGSEVEESIRRHTVNFADYSRRNPADIRSRIWSIPANVIHPSILYLVVNEGAPDVISVFVPVHQSDDLLLPAGMIGATYELAVDGAGWRKKMADPQVKQTPAVAIRTRWIALLMVGGAKFGHAQRGVGERMGAEVLQPGFQKDLAEIVRRVPEAAFLIWA